MPGTLYVVGTPIGNLGDFSPRATETLQSVDLIAAEDTRVTLRLLNHFGIKKPLVSYFEHNKRERGEEIVRRLLAGENCAIVTDAGMPVFSDPGGDLVDLCHRNAIPVSVVPGPCAAVSALSIAGLPAGRFCFEGFLSMNKKSRREHLAALAGEERTMVFYEAPHKLRSTLSDLCETFGERRIALVRELTKIHEEVIRTTLSQAVSLYDQNAPRGEFVLIVEGAQPEEKARPDEPDALQKAAALVQSYLEKGLTHSAAVRRAAKETGAARSELYALTLSDKEES